jgi:predicted naringenin-chalcone synthase
MIQVASSPTIKSRQETTSAILGIGTASPPFITQELSLEIAKNLTKPTPEQFVWMKRVFLRSGIESRGSVLTKDYADFYPPDSDPTTATRMARYALEAPPLAGAAAEQALAESALPPDAITHLITVSCTGFFAPGLDVSLIKQLGLSPNVRRQHLGFMGCHGAFNALAAARDAVRSDADAKVLVCSVELCSLHFAYGFDPGKLIANALFADGAAAVVIGAPTAGSSTAWQLEDTASMLCADSADAMTWAIGDHGFAMTLSPSVPDLIRQNLRAWCENWLANHDLRISDIASWAIHPGGPRILTAVAEALELDASVLRYSKEVLAKQGNMSSATVLFILQKMALQNAQGPCVAIGLGPGLMAEGMLLKNGV